MRKAFIKDFDNIIRMIEEARIDLRENGVDQWQGLEPSEQKIEKEISTNLAMVYEKDNEIVAYAYLSEEFEKAYGEISEKFKGKNYFTIHSFCVSGANKKIGVGTSFLGELIEFAEKMDKDSLRIDTHEDNKKMRGLIDKFDFDFRGEIFIDEEGVKKPRLAYELML